MKPQSNEARMRDGLAIRIWEDDGGAGGQDFVDEQFGRRIEADRSWTVYHVFTGVPAEANGQAMIGLSRLDATDGMLSLNLRNDERHRSGRRHAACLASTIRTRDYLS